MKLLPALLAAVLLGQAGASPWSERLAFWARGDLRRLDARLADLDAGLAGLAELVLVNSSVRVGLKTGYTTGEDVRWVELTLRETAWVDTVVLVPPLAKGAEAVVAGYGFPVRFKLEVFDEAGVAHMALDQTAVDFPNPGCFPVVARFPPRPVRRVRFTATDPWTADGPEVLALAELLVLAQGRNVAVEARVDSSSSRSAPRAWTRANLVDMVTPLGLPVAPQAGGSPGYHSTVAARADEPKWIQLELPETAAIDEIRLVPARVREVPLWFDYGFPATYRVELATRADFADAILLQETTESAAPGMNLVVIPARQTPARFVRLTATQLWFRRGDYVLALAELQVFRGEDNLARRGRFSASDRLGGTEGEAWSPEALGDNLTRDGRLLALPGWFEQLERRRGLEAERARVVAARAGLASRSRAQLAYGSVGGLGGMAGLFGLLLWRQRRQRRRDALRLQEKLARDLHDEIGSNLGSITLLCSLADRSGLDAETLRGELAEVGRVAAETADSMRDMVELLRPHRRENGRDWLDVLRRLGERQLRGLVLDAALPVAPLSREPDPETRREIYLFCKEALHNIRRHAGASHVSLRVSPAAGGGFTLEITDDGCGFDPVAPAAGHGLGNLRERAAVLKARLEIDSAPGRGTRLCLHVPRRPRWRPRRS